MKAAWRKLDHGTGPVFKCPTVWQERKNMHTDALLIEINKVYMRGIR